MEVVDAVLLDAMEKMEIYILSVCAMLSKSQKEERVHAFLAEVCINHGICKYTPSFDTLLIYLCTDPAVEGTDYAFSAKDKNTVLKAILPIRTTFKSVARH